MLNELLRVHVTGVSGVTSAAELERGVARLRGTGAAVKVDEGMDAASFVFCGDDATRAARFWKAAWDSESDVVWCARGGYGAARVLPELERLTVSEGIPPKKLLCGYSDVTALHEFVRSRWGWSSLHCTMPGGLSFEKLPAEDFELMMSLVSRRGPKDLVYLGLKSVGMEPLNDLTGVLVGGNLTVFTSLVGTPFAADLVGGRILFLEDVDEAPYRLDRYLNQLVQAGGFNGVKAVVLGTFAECADRVGNCGVTGKPLRKLYDEAEWKREVFGELSRALRIPVVGTLPVGHGEEKKPLPLGAVYTLTGEGELRLVSWDWLG